MKHSLRVLLVGLAGSLLGAVPCPAQAPAAGPAPLPRFYVGVHWLAQGQYQVFYPGAARAGVRPGQLTLGGQVAPRWEVQAGFSYHRQRVRRDPSYTGTMLNGDVVDGTYESLDRTYCVPVLARYAAVGFAHARGHVDAVLGATLVGAKFRYDAQDRVNGQLVRRVSQDEAATNGCLTAGAGVRYRLGRHWEGVVDGTYSRNLRFASAGTNRGTTGNRYGLTPAVSVGLRYRFAGHAKPVAL